LIGPTNITQQLRAQPKRFELPTPFGRRIAQALPRIREVSAHIATEVARIAYERNLATDAAPDDVAADIRSQMYEPEYRRYLPF
jgi:malic enzyme